MRSRPSSPGPFLGSGPLACRGEGAGGRGGGTWRNRSPEKGGVWLRLALVSPASGHLLLLARGGWWGLSLPGHCCPLDMFSPSVSPLLSHCCLLQKGWEEGAEVGAPRKPGLVGRSCEGGPQRVQGSSLSLLGGTSKTRSRARGQILTSWPWCMRLVWGEEAVGQPRCGSSSQFQDGSGKHPSPAPTPARGTAPPHPARHVD